MMVVAQNDIAPSGDGFGALPAAIPGTDSGQFPFGDDSAALSGDAAYGTEATEPDDPLAVLESLAPEVRDRVEQTFRQRVLDEAKTDFDNRFKEFQSTKDREVANALSARDTVGTALQLTQQWMTQYFTEVANGERQPDPRDIAVFEQQRDKFLRAENQKRQQAQTGVSQFEQQSRGRMQQKLERWSKDDTGNVVIDLTKDPELNALADKMFTAHRNRQEAEFNELYQQHVELAHAKKAAAVLARSQGRQPQQQAPSRQQARGPQNVARGGMPAGPQSLPDMIDTVLREWQDDPNKAKRPYREARLEAMTRYKNP